MPRHWIGDTDLISNSVGNEVVVSGHHGDVDSHLLEHRHCSSSVGLDAISKGHVTDILAVNTSMDHSSRVVRGVRGGGGLSSDLQDELTSSEEPTATLWPSTTPVTP